MQLKPLKRDYIISHCGYDELTQTLYVGFTQGACYMYSPIPLSLYQGLLEAEKPYVYYDANIRYHGYSHDSGYSHKSSPINYMTPIVAKRRMDEEARRKEAEQIERERIASRNYWLNMNGWQFEHAFATLLQGMKVEAKVTRGSGDGGVDILVKKGTDEIVIQCKNHASAVGPSTVRDLLGTAFSLKAKAAVLVATGGFTKGARSFSKANSIYLLDIEDVLALASGRSHPFRHFLAGI